MRRFGAVFVVCSLASTWLVLGNLPAQAAANQWSATGPEGGSVTALAIDPNAPATVYAGTYNGTGIYKSTDGGGTWAQTTQSNRRVLSITVDPTSSQIVYAGMQNNGVFKSTDAGATWNAATTGLGQSSVTEIQVDPTTPMTVYAATGAGVYKTTNGGTLWSPADSGITDNSVDGLDMSPTSPLTLYAATDAGVFKTTDGGANWLPMNAGLTDLNTEHIVVSPSNPAVIWVGTTGSVGVYRSTDGGATWVPKPGPNTHTARSLAVNPADAGTAYFGGNGDGVWKTSDGGDTWLRVNNGLIGNLVPEALAVDPADTSTVYAGTDGRGVFKTTNGATSWTQRSTGMIATQVHAVAVIPGSATIFAGAVGAGVFRSTDFGETWTNTMTNLGVNPSVEDIAVDPTDPDRVYAISSGNAVWLSHDGGVTWAGSGNSPPGEALAIDPVHPATIYAGSNGDAVFKSTNGGATFVKTSNGLTSTDVEALVIDPDSHLTVYAGTGDGVFKSTNGGEAWVPMSMGMVNTTVRSLAIDPTNPDTLYAGMSSGDPYKSTDGAATWTPLPGLGGGQVEGIAIDPTNTQVVYMAAAGNNGMWRSADGGTTFDPLNSGLHNRDMNAVTTAFGGTTIIAGSNGGAPMFSTAFPLVVTKGAHGGGAVTSQPAGITCGPTCTAAFSPGQVVQLAAAAGPDSTFDGWSGDCTGTGACQVTMDTARVVTATFVGPGVPDAQIAKGKNAFAGDDVYNATGASQTKTASVKPGKSATFRLKIQNDGDPDSFTVKGCKGKGAFGVVYKSGKSNVTSQVVAGTFGVGPIDFGVSKILTLIMTAKGAAAAGSSKSCLVTAGFPGSHDTVKAKLKVV
jgi:photosystem II stability/assembly factor-like uncharacterized protein